jgi:hypothetical protein
MLENEIVNVGDFVYDLILRTGRVTGITPQGSIEAVFGARTVTYSAGGFLAGAKRLYWHDPVLIVPKKDDAENLNTYRRLIAAVQA